MSSNPRRMWQNDEAQAEHARRGEARHGTARAWPKPAATPCNNVAWSIALACSRRESARSALFSNTSRFLARVISASSLFAEVNGSCMLNGIAATPKPRAVGTAASARARRELR